MRALACSSAVIGRTLALLQAGGRRGHERVVLWLAPAVAPTAVTEVYEPEQRTARDRFHLPPESLRALMARLRAGRLKVAAQVHTHPGRAFHSDADAHWAIVRHVGALSLVLPRFAADTTPETFLDHAMTYECAADGTWTPVPNRGSGARLELTA